jgi:hypothetical protein
MLPEEFEPTTEVFEQAKTVHALDRATTVIGGHYAEKAVKKGHVRLSVCLSMT